MAVTDINFVRVNGRSLYIVDGRMVVVERKECPTPCKQGGECLEMSREYVRRNMSRGECLDPISPRGYLTNSDHTLVSTTPLSTVCHHSSLFVNINLLTEIASVSVATLSNKSIFYVFVSSICTEPPTATTARTRHFLTAVVHDVINSIKIIEMQKIAHSDSNMFRH